MRFFNSLYPASFSRAFVAVALTDDARHLILVPIIIAIGILFLCRVNHGSQPENLFRPNSCFNY